MKKEITLLAVLMIMLVLGLKAQYMTVGDPQEEWWYYNQGTIEDAEFVLRPQGLYLGVDMYLTFSGKDMLYSAEDTIEFVCNFDLPHGSIINDSWLWLNQDTLIADMLDRWTASTIYNEIVGRQQDPSILYKTWGNEYELRIYPMQGDSSRRVKISYLAPFTFTSKNVSAQFPIDLLQASYHEVENVKIHLLTDDTWKNAKVQQYPEIEFQNQVNNTYSTNKLLEFNSNDFGSYFTLQFDSPMKEGVFFNYLDNEEDYYQLAVLPSVFIESIEPKKVLVTVDFVNNNYFEKEDLYNSLKLGIIDGLSKNDYVNIMFSSTNIEPIFTNWVQVKDLADSIKQLETTGILSKEIIKSYSNLPSLLGEGLSYLVNNEGDDLYIIANSEEDGDPSEVNELMTELFEIIGDNDITVHAADFMTDYNNYYWTGSTSYYGNEYLYINLTKQTGGNTKRIKAWEESLDDFILSFTSGIDGAIETFDLYTSATNGFCYNRLDITKNSVLVYLNQPVLQVGKFYGEFPFSVEVNGLYNDLPFSTKILIEQSDVTENDSLLEEIWAGNYIAELERNLDYYSNEAIREIVDYSVQERVLSQYTAFLAIEPGALDEIPESNFDVPGDEEWILDIDNEKVELTDNVEIQSFPNPFVSDISFRLQLPQNYNNEKIAVSIYSLTGKLILVSTVKQINSGMAEFTWNGNDSFGTDVVGGTYIVVFESQLFRKVSKVVKY